MFEKVLTTRRRVLGPKHPHTLETAKWLAGLALVASRKSTTPTKSLESGDER